MRCLPHASRPDTVLGVGEFVERASPRRTNVGNLGHTSRADANFRTSLVVCEYGSSGVLEERASSCTRKALNTLCRKRPLELNPRVSSMDQIIAYQS